MGNSNDSSYSKNNKNYTINLSSPIYNISNSNQIYITSQKRNKNLNKNQNNTFPFNTFCGSISSQETLNNKKRTEIDLSSTYIIPKGNYTLDSIKFFGQKEKNLFYFIGTNNISAIRYLTINGVNINILDEERTSPLHIACNCANIQTIEEIINQGAMINIPDIIGWTPLHIACYYNRPDVVLLLLKHGANYKTKDRDKISPLDLCNKYNYYICKDVIDNFIKYQKIEMEKYINKISEKNNINNEIYNELLKKFLYFQKLKGEYLQTHDDINDINEEMENDEYYFNNNVLSQQNDEEKKIFEKIENFLFSLNKDGKNDFNNNVNKIFNYNENISRNKLNLNNQESKSLPLKIKKHNKNNLLSSYKYIPHKHKFYLNYKYENGTLSTKINKDNNIEYNLNNDNLNNSENYDSNPIIQKPSSLPVMNSIQSLNEIKKTKTLNSNCFNIIGNAEEIYKTYDNNEESSTDSENSIHIETPLKQLNLNKDKDNNTSLDKLEKEIQLNFNNKDEDDEDDKTLTIDDENLNYNITIDNNNISDEQKILNPFIFPKFKKNNLNIFFEQHDDIFEEILLYIFKFDYFYGLLFLIQISGINNSIKDLINYITKHLYNNKLKTLILTQNSNSLLKIYFDSFSYKNCSYLESIYKSFKIFDFTLNDIKLIDDLSFNFSKIYYKQNNKNPLYFNSENSIYYFTFSLIIMNLNYFNQNETNKEKVIIDMILMIKNLNEGEDYEINLIKDCIAEVVKEKGVVNIIRGFNYYLTENFTQKIIKIKIIKNEKKTKIYSCFYNNGLFIILNNINSIFKCYYVKIKNKIIYKRNNDKISFICKTGNLIEIKNKGNFLNFKEINKLEMIIDKDYIYKELDTFFNNN